MDFSTVTTIGIDLAKRVIQVHGATKTGRVVFRKRLCRKEVVPFMMELQPCVVGMEACGGAHYWGKQLQAVGHTVKLMPPQYVKPYVKTNKNDVADAEACCEAVTRPTMRFVEIKSAEQQDMLQLHRVRERLVKARTALSNEVQGFFTEWGIVFPRGISKLANRAEEAMKKEGEKLTIMGRELIGRLVKEFGRLQEEIRYYDEKLNQIHEAHPVSQRLASIPGVGPMTATAIVAIVGNPNRFENGRQFSAYLGLVPGQNLTGGDTKRLGKISKRGDGYVRKLLIQGAHAVLLQVQKHNDTRSMWLKALMARKGRCKAAVALANKNARVIWVLLTKEERFRLNPCLKVNQVRTVGC